MILDLQFREPIIDAADLAERLKGTVGVVERRLFLGWRLLASSLVQTACA